jgi:hypothetical protein
MRSQHADENVAFGSQPELTDQDVSYVSSTFRAQTEAERRRAAAGCAPKPAYLLPDGTGMTSAKPDEELASAADSDDLRRRFKTR